MRVLKQSDLNVYHRKLEAPNSNDCTIGFHLPEAAAAQIRLAWDTCI